MLEDRDSFEKKQEKTGLIMEGGAMRGLFTCGVLDVFLENDIKFDGAAGISAGAVFGCNFKSGQIGRPLRYNKRYCKDPRYCSIRSLIKTGDLYGADFCYRELPQVLDPFDCAAFEANPMKFYIGATDVQTGKTVFHKCSDGGTIDTAWMQASASMPLVSRTVHVDGYELLDGGISCPVPYAYMEEIGYFRNVIVLTQPLGYRKKPAKILPLIRLGLHRYPKIVEAMEKRHIVYNRQTEEIRTLEQSGRVLVIRPPEELRIGHSEHNPEELERVYRIGRAEAVSMLEKVKEFLNV